MRKTDEKYKGTKKRIQNKRERQLRGRKRTEN